LKRHDGITPLHGIGGDRDDVGRSPLPAQAHTVLSFVDVAAKGAQHAPYRAPTISNYRMTIVQGGVQSPPARLARRAHAASGILARRS
jgi:hypothetical protein